MSWTLMENEGNGPYPKSRRIYLISSQDDISSPPSDNDSIAPGSEAYTPDLTAIYIKNAEGEWTKVGG